MKMDGPTAPTAFHALIRTIHNPKKKANMIAIFRNPVHIS
jgi:hypothetical protein